MTIMNNDKAITMDIVDACAKLHAEWIYESGRMRARYSLAPLGCSRLDAIYLEGQVRHRLLAILTILSDIT